MSFFQIIILHRQPQNEKDVKSHKAKEGVGSKETSSRTKEDKASLDSHEYISCT